MEDDDDAFLYGSEASVNPEAVQTASPVFPTAISSKGVNGAIETALHTATDAFAPATAANGNGLNASPLVEAQEEEDEEEEEEEEEDDESDVEIILDAEPLARSRDFRPVHAQPPRPNPNRVLTNTGPRPPTGPQGALTEYTPRERGTPLIQPPPPSLTPSQPNLQLPPPQGFTQSPEVPQIPNLAELVQHASSFLTSSQQPPSQAVQATYEADPSLPDPFTLPPVTAPPSVPQIDTTATGMYSSDPKEEPVPIFDVDMENLAEKGWRRPASDISDWFNYGFDEISWEAYCVQRRDMAALAAEMKANVLNMAGMPEEMLQNSVPPEMRSMLIAQSARMNIPQQLQPQSQQQEMQHQQPLQMPQMPSQQASQQPQLNQMNSMNQMGQMPQMQMPMQMPMNSQFAQQNSGGMSHIPMQNGMNMNGGGAGPSNGFGGPQMPFGFSVNGMPDAMGMGLNMGMGIQNQNMGNVMHSGPGNIGGAASMGHQFGGFPNGNDVPGVVPGNAGLQQLQPQFPSSMGAPQDVSLANEPEQEGGDFINLEGQGQPQYSPESAPKSLAESEAASAYASMPGGRGRGAFRGRGGVPSRAFGGGVALGPPTNRPAAPQVLPKRPSSPLPPNVPTGPRNQQPRYKDKDRDTGFDKSHSDGGGLDYGGSGNGSTNGGADEKEEGRSRDRDKDRAERARDREREKERDRDRDRDREREREREKEKERERERDRDHRERDRARERERDRSDRDRGKERERDRPERSERRSSKDVPPDASPTSPTSEDPPERKPPRDRSPPSAPRKDKEKEERERKKREEKERRGLRETSTKEDRSSRKRSHSEDYEEPSESRRPKRR